MIISTDSEIRVTKMGITHTSLEYRVATEIQWYHTNGLPGRQGCSRYRHPSPPFSTGNAEQSHRNHLVS